MKKIFLVITIICGSYLSSSAQFGVKGGLNFSSNGDLKEIGEDIKADGKTGYHVGIMYQTKGDGFYLRPELVYTSTKSEYANKGEFTMNKIDLPILLGYHIFKPISIFAGPSLQYILNSDLKGFNLNAAENDFTIGVQFGAAVQLGEKLTVDLRYEKGLSKNLAEIAGISGDKIDTRPTQLILSLALKF
jgi:opacity protein-like surface antigen